MKASVSTAMASHLAQDVSTLAYLWKVIRQDGEIFGFTNHDQPITYEGLTYEAATGFMPSAVTTTSGLSVDDVELEGVLSSEAISQDDLLIGRWDGAEVWLYQVNYKALADGAIIVRRGWTGEVRAGQLSFITELRGMTQRLAQQIGQNYSPSCRADFADSRCKLNLANYRVTGAVTDVNSRRSFVDDSRSESRKYFNAGLIRFTSGENAGSSREVKYFSEGTIICELPFAFDISIGDTYELWRGCDKRLQTCRDKYNNVINFRGEPFVPILDSLVSGPK